MRETIPRLLLGRQTRFRLRQSRISEQHIGYDPMTGDWQPPALPITPMLQSGCPDRIRTCVTKLTASRTTAVRQDNRMRVVGSNHGEQVQSLPSYH